MEILEFAQKVQKAVMKRLGEDYIVQLQEVCKNNSVMMQGLNILNKNRNISPTIYLNSFWEAYEEGVPLSVIVDKICIIYQEDTPKEKVDISFFKEFEQVKDRICYKLISAKRNSGLLEQIPHMKYLDLAICFYYAYQGESLGCGSILIYHSHLKLWQTDVKQIWELARKNTPKLFPWECSTMSDVLGDNMIPLPLKVLSNDCKVLGAAAMMYPDVLKQLSAEAGCNLYIIPSSIHEVILLPDDGEVDTDALRRTITEVNETQVEADEVLSEQLYFYNHFLNNVRIVS